MAAGHVKFYETADLKFTKLVLKNLREFIHNPVGETCLKSVLNVTTSSSCSKSIAKTI